MRALTATILCSAVLVATACRKPPPETEGRPSTLETTSASAKPATVSASTPIAAPAEKAGEKQKPKPVKGPVDFALEESGVAVKVPAGYVIQPEDIEGFWSIEAENRPRRSLAQISFSFSFKTGAEHAKDSFCDETQTNVKTTNLAGGGVMTTCDGSSQAIKIAGTETKTTKVRSHFPIKEQDRDSMHSSVQCSFESDDAKNIAITKTVCGSLHAVPVTHAVAPETKDLKPGARCFKDSNCGSVAGCGSTECSYKSDGSRAKICRVDIEHGAVGQSCGATRSPSMLQHFPSSPGYAPDSGKTVVCNLDDGLFCDPTTWTCQPPAKLGATCGDKTMCERDTLCKSGTCVAAAKPGESCADKRCVASAKCDEKKICRAFTPVGAPCTIGKNECQFQCYRDKCAPNPASERQCSL